MRKIKIGQVKGSYTLEDDVAKCCKALQYNGPRTLQCVKALSIVDQLARQEKHRSHAAGYGRDSELLDGILAVDK